ncbi:hypothetical protein Tco_1041133 [Tanacetum coccineum]|uniref:Uncharacterized protein n=1 Tax=Tanacetum coccineum TaxID=301880 RepID=A0ABQ5GHX2_9ASTR
MAQHVIPAAQLVPQYKTIRRCNNYAVLQSIPCSPECKIVGQILLDHPLSYALTTTADVPAVYLQQFWRTVSKVPYTEDTIKFLLDTQQFTFTMDIVGYQGVVNKVSAFFTKNLAQPWQTMFKDFINNVFQKKEAIQYPCFIKLIIADLMKKFPNIPKMLEEDYHSIKDDVPLVSVYTTGNVLVRGMLIPDALLIAEIRYTDDFKEYETVTPIVSASPQETKKRKQTAGESSSSRIIIKKKKPSTPSIPPPGDNRERDEMAEATILSLTLHKIALDAEAKENIAKVQEMLAQEEIDELVDGDEDEESSASAFADTVLNDVDDDIGSKLEPGSYKEHPEHVSDDDEKKKKDEEVEKEKEVVEIVKDTNVDDTSAKKNEEFVTEKEVVDIRRELIRSHIKNKFITREFFAEKIKEVLQHYNTIVAELTVATTNEIIKKEMPRLVKLAVDKDREVSPVDISGMVSKAFAAHAPKMIDELFRQHMQNTTLNLYPKSRSSTATKSSADLQQQLYHTMKEKPQDQAANPEIWESLKAKFEKP